VGQLNRKEIDEMETPATEKLDRVLSYVMTGSGLVEGTAAELNAALAEGFRVVDILVSGSESIGQNRYGFVVVTVLLTKDTQSPYRQHARSKA
jgi:hypothetical protein